MDRGLFYKQRTQDRDFREAGRVSGGEIGPDMVIKGIAIAGLAAMTGGALAPLLAGVLAPALMGFGSMASGAVIGGAAGMAGGAAAGLAGSGMSGFKGGLSGTLKNMGMGAGIGGAGGSLVGGVAGATGTGAAAASGAQASGAGTNVMTPAGPVNIGADGAMTQITSANAASLGYTGMSGATGTGTNVGTVEGGDPSDTVIANKAGAVLDKFGSSSKVVGQGLSSTMQEAGAIEDATAQQLLEAQQAGSAAQVQSAQANAAGLQSRIAQKNAIFEDNPFYDPIEDFDAAQAGVF